MKFSLNDISRYGLSKENYDACADRILESNFRMFRTGLIISFFAFAFSLLETEWLGVLYDYGGAFIVYFFVTGLMFVFLIRRPDFLKKHATVVYYLYMILLLSYPLVTNRVADWERMVNFPVIMALVVLPFVDNFLRVAVLVAAADLAALVLMRYYQKHPTVIADDTMSILIFSIAILIGHYFFQHYRLKDMLVVATLKKTQRELSEMAERIREAEEDVRVASGNVIGLLDRLEEETKALAGEAQSASAENKAQADTLAESAQAADTVAEEEPAAEAAAVQESAVTKEAAAQEAAPTAQTAETQTAQEAQTAETPTAQDAQAAQTPGDGIQKEGEPMPFKDWMGDAVAIVPWDEEDVSSWELLPLDREKAEQMHGDNAFDEESAPGAVTEKEESVDNLIEKEERAAEEEHAADSAEEEIAEEIAGDAVAEDDITEDTIEEDLDEEEPDEEEDFEEDDLDEEDLDEEEDLPEEEEIEEEIEDEIEEDLDEEIDEEPADEAFAEEDFTEEETVEEEEEEEFTAPHPVYRPAPAAPAVQTSAAPAAPAAPASSLEALMQQTARPVITPEEMEGVTVAILADALEGDLESVKNRLRVLNTQYAVPGIYRLKVMQLENLARAGNAEGIVSFLNGGNV